MQWGDLAHTMDFCLNVPKHSTYQYDIHYYFAEGTVDWTGRMMVYTSGSPWTFAVRGKYQMVSTTEIIDEATQIASRTPAPTGFSKCVAMICRGLSEKSY